MSWQLGAFTLLAFGLAGGFAWYERTRPDARIVALVATLAAFAALGRIAFAALPNVKPTTDIVLITGYTLGGAPGFVVGALAGLTSNFFFGQGPWTPWQMVAWGVTGLTGAGLALVTRDRIGRWPLALVCTGVGFAFAATQDFGDWVTYSDHSGAQLGVYVGKGIGFDVVHAAGCLAFALAFGPALRRSIERFARRLSVQWRAAGTTVVPGLLVAIVLAGAVLGVGRARAAGAGTPTSYLLSAQRPDGGFGSTPGGSSSQLYAGWAALGLAAAGHNPADVSRGGRSLLKYIEAGTGSLPDTGSIERTILVAAAAGVSPRSFGGHDLVAELEHRIRGDGSLSQQVNWTAFGVLALRAAGIAPPPRMLSWIARQEDRDGGFSFATRGGASDVDDTGSALEALGRHVPRAVAFLRRQQNADGGFPSEPGAVSNSQSTAFAVQGLLAAGVGLGSLPHGSPLRYLRGLTGPDGDVRYARGSEQTPVWVTAEALLALSGKPLPLAAAPLALRVSAHRRHPDSNGTLEAGPASRPVQAPRAAHLHHRAPGPSAVSLASGPVLRRFAVVAALATALVLAPVDVG